MALDKTRDAAVAALADALWTANNFDPMAQYADVKRAEVEQFATDILAALNASPAAKAALVRHLLDTMPEWQAEQERLARENPDTAPRPGSSIVAEQIADLTAAGPNVGPDMGTERVPLSFHASCGCYEQRDTGAVGLCDWHRKRAEPMSSEVANNETALRAALDQIDELARDSESASRVRANDDAEASIRLHVQARTYEEAARIIRLAVRDDEEPRNG